MSHKDEQRKKLTTKTYIATADRIIERDFFPTLHALRQSAGQGDVDEEVDLTDETLDEFHASHTSEERNRFDETYNKGAKVEMNALMFNAPGVPALAYYPGRSGKRIVHANTNFASMPFDAREAANPEIEALRRAKEIVAATTASASGLAPNVVGIPRPAEDILLSGLARKRDK